MSIVGKNKHGEVIEVVFSKKEYKVTVTPKETEEKKKSKKDEGTLGFGSYTNSFPNNSVEVKGLRALPEGKTEVELKFAGEKKKFLFVVDKLYHEVSEMFAL